MLKPFTHHYTKAAVPHRKKIFQHILKIPIFPNLQKEYDSCGGILIKKECWDVLHSMKNNKSPGNDGLTKEFYVCFLNEISSDLDDALNRSFKVGQLSASQCQALIKSIKDKK